MENQLRFSLRELTAPVTEREVILPPQELGLPDGIGTGAGPVVVTLQFTRAGRRVHVRGEVRLSVDLACVRCLRPIRRELRAPVEIVAEPRPEAARMEEEVPEGIVYHDAEAFDLREEVRQVLVLESPSHPLCQADCRGLCPHCGADLNRGRCGCPAAESADPRWAALRALQGEKRRDGGSHPDAARSS